MTYWLFDGGDIVGPFTVRELLNRAGFSAGSLVCPEDHSNEETYWKAASFYPDFGFDATESIPPELLTAQNTDQSFEKEFEKTLHEGHSLLNGSHHKPLQAEPLALPKQRKKAFKSSPIETYFDHIKEGDLGNILGIPGPDENSDMNLNRALQTQFGETTPPTSSDLQAEMKDPFDEFTVPVPEPLDAETLVQPAVVFSGNPKTLEDTLRKEELLPEGAPSAQTPPIKHSTRPLDSVSKKESPSSIKLSKDKPSVHALQAAPVYEVPWMAESKAPSREKTAQPEPTPAQPILQTPPLVLAAATQAPEQEPVSQKQDLPPTFATPPVEPALQGAVSAKQEAAPVSDIALAMDTAVQMPLLPPDQEDFALHTLPRLPQEEETPAPLAALPSVGEEKPAPAIQSRAQAALPSKSTPKEAALPAHKTDLRFRNSPAPTLEEAVFPAQESVQEPVAAAEQTVRDILDGTLRIPAKKEVKEPIKEVSIMEPTELVRSAQADRPATAPVVQIRREAPFFAEPSSTETDFLKPATHVVKSSVSKKAGIGALFVAILGVSVALYLNQTVGAEHAAAASAPMAAVGVHAPTVVEGARSTPKGASPVKVAAASGVPGLSAIDKARLAVQNYYLPREGITIGQYFDRMYTRSQDGFSTLWSAEPLHKSVYTVRFRVTKTRKEPIVYIFQVDTAKNQVIGALNNVTLDLVGKMK